MARLYERPVGTSGPLKAFAHRFWIVVYFVLALVLMVLSKAGNPTVTRFQVAVSDGVSYLLTVLVSPIDGVHILGNWISDMGRIHARNQALRTENTDLRRWQNVARELKRENQRLHELMALYYPQTTAFATTRVIGDSGGAFVRAVLLGAGVSAGLRKGQAVVNAEGLVGHIVAVGDRSARALLLTDLNSRIPVRLESSGYKAILAGDNGGEPYLAFLSLGAKPRAGERVLTSGDGGVLPPGIPVGVVAADGDEPPRIRLYVDYAKLELVRILAYRAPALRETDDPATSPEGGQ